MINIVFCIRSSLEVMFVWARENADGRSRHNAVQNGYIRTRRRIFTITTYSVGIQRVDTYEKRSNEIDRDPVGFPDGRPIIRTQNAPPDNRWNCDGRKYEMAEMLLFDKTLGKTVKIMGRKKMDDRPCTTILFTRERCAVTGE
jgi:hypothetical protein